MRVLALDYGSARCGCALSDPTGTIVTPIEVVLRPNSKRGMAALVQLVAEREVQRVVVGLPLSLAGGETEQTRVRHASSPNVWRVAWARRCRRSFTTSASDAMAQRLDGPASTSRTRARRRTC